MTIMFVRRRALGMGSVRGFKSWGTELFGENSIDWVRNDRLDTKDWDNVSYVVRWGCTSTIPRRSDGTRVPVINKARAIHACSNKAGFRKSFQESGSMFNIPSFSSSWGDPVLPCIVRPHTHSRGRNLYYCRDNRELNYAASICEGWYAGEYIPKVEEYRVYVVGGRAVALARKEVEDKSEVAWNRARVGAEFQNVLWGSWPLMVVKAGIDAVNHLGLDFGGADIMVDKEDRPYVLEVNSAPSHPLLDKETSHRRNSRLDVAERRTYRQKCFVNGLMNHTKSDKLPVTQVNNWRDVIHPGVSGEARAIHDALVQSP